MQLQALESVMCDLIKIRLMSIFLGVSFPTSPVILTFKNIFMMSHMALSAVSNFYITTVSLILSMFFIVFFCLYIIMYFELCIKHKLEIYFILLSLSIENK